MYLNPKSRFNIGLVRVGEEVIDIVKYGLSARKVPLKKSSTEKAEIQFEKSPYEVTSGLSPENP